MNERYLNMIAKLGPMLSKVADEEISPRFRARDFNHDTKQDGSVLTEVDGSVQQRLEALLSDSWPDIAFLGEEMDLGKQQKLIQSQAVWCLDPLDGTSNFASGIPYFAVSLALIEDQEIKLGVIYDPSRQESFTAVKGEGCWLNGTKLTSESKAGVIEELKEMIAVVDLKRLNKNLLLPICELHPYRSQRNFGSCALEWCWLAAGRFQLYLHGGQKVWDYTAGSLILSEAGGMASTIEGEGLYTQTLTARSVVAGYNHAAYQLWYDWVTNNK